MPSPFIPTSRYRDVANHVAYALTETGQKQGSELVILTLELPVIETVGNKGVFFEYATANTSCTLYNEDNAQLVFPSHNYEDLVYGNIPSSCIRDVSPGYIPIRKYENTARKTNEITIKSIFPSELLKKQESLSLPLVWTKQE